MEIEKKILEYIEEKTGTNPEHDTNFIEYGIFDSMEFVLFVSFLEKEFHITIPEEDLKMDNFLSVGNVVVYLQNRVKQA